MLASGGIFTVQEDKQGSFITGVLRAALAAAGDLSREVIHKAVNDTDLMTDDGRCRYCGIVRSPLEQIIRLCAKEFTTKPVLTMQYFLLRQLCTTGE